MFKTALPQETASQTGMKQTSVLRGFRRSIRSYRLGDLLIDGGLLREEDLAHALTLQKTTRQPLGKILVAQGYVSAVQIYRKLAEQWCIKASTAGMALMLQTFTPSTARADDGGQVRLAAVFAPSAVKPVAPAVAKPRVFGALEIKSNDISAFGKWTDTMKRFEAQMTSAKAHTPQVLAWTAKLQSLKGLTQTEQLRAVNDYINLVRYIEDAPNHGQSDYWATPVEFFAKGGDCEDYAIAKYASLRALGFSTEQLRISIVQDKIKNIAHAVLVVYTDDGAFVLDNQDKRTRRMEEVTRYQATYSINSSNWWLHRTPAGGANS